MFARRARRLVVPNFGLFGRGLAAVVEQHIVGFLSDNEAAPLGFASQKGKDLVDATNTGPPSRPTKIPRVPSVDYIISAGTPMYEYYKWAILGNKFKNALLFRAAASGNHDLYLKVFEDTKPDPFLPIRYVEQHHIINGVLEDTIEGAAIGGNTDIVKHVFECRPKITTNAVKAAAGNCDIEMIRYLIELSQDPMNNAKQAPFFEDHALYYDQSMHKWACMGGQPAEKIICFYEFLREEIGLKGWYEDTSFEWVTRLPEVDVIKLLEYGRGVRGTPVPVKLPFFKRAARRGFAELLEYASKKELVFENRIFNNGYAMVSVAIYARQFGVVKFLIDNDPRFYVRNILYSHEVIRACCDVRWDKGLEILKNIVETTPLMAWYPNEHDVNAAARYGNAPVFEYLLKLRRHSSRSFGARVHLQEFVLGTMEYDSTQYEMLTFLLRPENKDIWDDVTRNTVLNSKSKFLAAFVCVSALPAIKLLVDSGVEWDKEVYTELWHGNGPEKGLADDRKWQERHLTHFSSLNAYMKDNNMDW